MNVALVIDGLGAGGAESVVRQLACGLIARGHRACVYCLKNAGAPAEELRQSGVSVREANSTGFDPSLSWRLGKWMRADGIDVVHAHNSASLVHSLLPTRLLRIPLIQTRHGPLLGAASRHRRMADALARFTDRVTIVSESLRRDLPAAVAAASLHVPNGVDRELVSRGEARRKLEQLCGAPFGGPVVLSVGTICAEKDTLGLLEAFAKVCRARTDVTLVCIGGSRDETYLSRVEMMRRSEGLTECVHLVGEAGHAWRFMAGVEVFCLSSRTEAAPMVVLEAMSQRAAIVATAVGDVGSLGAAGGMIQHGRNGLLVAPGDAGALADGIQSVLEDPNAARRRSETAAEDYENHYTAARMTRGYERVYLSCRQDAPGTLRRGARRPRILMVGPAPPTIGGMVSVIDTLMTGALRDRFDLIRFPTSGQRKRHREGTLGLIRSVNRHMTSLASLSRAIVADRINLIHIHTCSNFSFYRSLADLLVGKLLGRRVILHVHGGQFDRFCLDSGWIGRSAIRRGCELADAIVVLSQDWRDRLSPFTGRARLEVVPNGMSIPRSGGRRGPPADALRAESVPCRFIFVGALTRRKGIRELLEAAVWLRGRGSAFELFVAGPRCENEPDWAGHVRLVGLESEVTFVGTVAGPGKAALFESADCLVLPSHVEGLPVVILEAAACGLPVIASDVGSTAELLTKSAADGSTREISPLVPAGDAVALGEAMARLLDDAPLRHEMGAALRDHVARNFSLAVQTRSLTRLYQSLLGEYARRAVSDAIKSSGVIRPPTGYSNRPEPQPRRKTPQATVCP